MCWREGMGAKRGLSSFLPCSKGAVEAGASRAFNSACGFAGASRDGAGTVGRCRGCLVYRLGAIRAPIYKLPP